MVPKKPNIQREEISPFLEYLNGCLDSEKWRAKKK